MCIYLQLLPALTWLYNSSIQSIFRVLIHYCASSMVCEFLLLLQALTQYVMCRELRIRVSAILYSKELSAKGASSAASSLRPDRVRWRTMACGGVFCFREQYCLFEVRCTRLVPGKKMKDEVSCTVYVVVSCSRSEMKMYLLLYVHFTWTLNSPENVLTGPDSGHGPNILVLLRCHGPK